MIIYIHDTWYTYTRDIKYLYELISEFLMKFDILFSLISKKCQLGIANIILIRPDTNSIIIGGLVFWWSIKLLSLYLLKS